VQELGREHAFSFTPERRTSQQRAPQPGVRNP
jgi:hypothetical protein